MRAPYRLARPPLRLWLPVVAALVAFATLATVLVPRFATRRAADRIRSAARARGLEAHWQTLRFVPPDRMQVKGLALWAIATGDTVLRADSIEVALDARSLLAFHPTVRALTVHHARLVRKGRLAPEDEDADTLDASAAPSAGAERVRRAAESLAKLLLSPARALPGLTLDDVALEAPSEDGMLRGASITHLDLVPSAAGVVLTASGALHLSATVPFQVRLGYGNDDRLAGWMRFGIPDSARGGNDTLTIGVDGALHQERNAGVVRIADGTRVTIGQMPFEVRGTIDRHGPRITLALEGDGLSGDRVLASLPRPVLGPLEQVRVTGGWDYRAAIDLDFARPDSVEVRADVIPRGLALDPVHTQLRLLGLEQPFVAEIHLPHDRIATRDLSPANPYFRPLGAIDSVLVHAVVTNEDGGFFRHGGFNLEAVKRAIAANLEAGAYRRGAGTITMQLARNLYLGHARTLSRKFQEVVLAWILEHLTWASKARLLEIYLNIIEWGPGVHGAAEAAHWYFDRDPAHLDVAEALFLTTLIPSPSKWRNRFDRDGVLRPYVRAQMHFIGRAMVAKGWLDPAALPPADSLRVEPRGPAHEALFPIEAAHADSLHAI